MSRTMNHSLSDRAAPTSQEFITQIYKKYDRLMLFTAKKYLMDLQECEDAVQESLLKLMSRIELLRTLEEPVLTSYVVTTVRNTAINILRRQKRDAQNITSFTESVEESIIELDSIIDIMMLLFTTAFAASPSFRAQTLTVLVEMFDDHGEIRFNGITNSAETHEMSILWMPDGYQIGLEEFDESRMIISAEGENGESLNVAATAISESRSYSFDTEGATEEPATVRGNEAVVYQVKTEDEDKVTVLWTDMENGWIVRVTGYNISKEDMLRISENVEIR